MARNAARLACLEPHGIDINFGCPAKTVNKHGGGAALLDSPATLEKVVGAVRCAVPAGLLVSAKMRLGVTDDRRAEECARAIEAGGAQELVVHARTKLQGYQPPALWKRIRDIRKAVGIRVIANGEIWSVEDARRCVEESGCEDLMLGRGMVSDPGLARAILASGVLPGHGHDAGQGCAPPGWKEMASVVLDFWMRHAGRASVVARAGRLKQWLIFLRRRFPEAGVIFSKIRTRQDAEAITLAIHESLF
jgi:tRNA-dihydrouridine synthase C